MGPLLELPFDRGACAGERRERAQPPPPPPPPPHSPPPHRALRLPLPQTEHKFSSFKEFRDAFFMPLMLGYKKHAVGTKLAKDKDEIKEKGQRMATLGLNWVKEHFSDIEFYSLETTAVDGSNFGDEFKDDTYSANFAMLHYDDGDKPHLYFFVDLYKGAKV